MKNKNDIVALNDSQILRWICELNGIENLDYEVSKLKLRRFKNNIKSQKNQKQLRLTQSLEKNCIKMDLFVMVLSIAE